VRGGNRVRGGHRYDRRLGGGHAFAQRRVAMATELAVTSAFRLLRTPLTSGVEPFLGNDRNPLVAILGYNPGLNGTPHPIGAPTNGDEMHEALHYFRSYFENAPREFNKVWSRYCWMLNPGATPFPHTEGDFAGLAPRQLLILNLYQSQTTTAKDMTPQQRQGKGQVALALLESACPRVLVVQGADAWHWIRSQTQRVDSRPHLSRKLCDIYPRHPLGDVGCVVEFKEKRIPGLRVRVLPVFHLTGREHFRAEATRFAALQSRYREELNRLWQLPMI
jgi:hypothetical protein